MDKFLVKEFIGEFFSKMYEANKGKDMEITLKTRDDSIQIYHRDTVTFDEVTLIDERPTIDGLVKSLSE